MGCGKTAKGTGCQGRRGAERGQWHKGHSTAFPLGPRLPLVDIDLTYELSPGICIFCALVRVTPPVSPCPGTELPAPTLCQCVWCIKPDSKLGTGCYPISAAKLLPKSKSGWQAFTVVL